MMQTLLKRPSLHECGFYCYTLEKDGTARIYYYWGEEEHVVLPSELDGHPVTAIRHEAFSPRRPAVQITIPRQITQVEGNPFFRAVKLKNLIVEPGNPVLKVKDRALFDVREKRLVCYPCGLQTESFTVPQGTKEIGECAFYDCRQLKNIILSPELEVIGRNAFACCNALTQVHIPEGVKTIGGNAFYQFTPVLGPVALPRSLAYLEDCAFGRNWENVIIPSDHPALEVVDGMLFDKRQKRLIRYLGNNAKTSCHIPAGTVSIASGAFQLRRELEQVTIGPGLKYIGQDAFAFCEKMKKITIPQGVQSIGRNAFYGCRSLEQIILPSGITAIEEGTFRECRAMTQALIPAGVTTIGECAFHYCESLKEMILPPGVQTIGGGAFFFCKNMQTLALPDSITCIEDDDGAYSLESPKNLLVKKGSYAHGWALRQGFDCTFVE